MLSSGMITPPLFIFPGNFTHSRFAGFFLTRRRLRASVEPFAAPGLDTPASHTGRRDQATHWKLRNQVTFFPCHYPMKRACPLSNHVSLICLSCLPAFPSGCPTYPLAFIFLFLNCLHACAPAGCLPAPLLSACLRPCSLPACALAVCLTRPC
jgi:hypothetical protein